jgi:polyhydroxyalkanoate synthesis regulator phasin
VLVLLGLGLGFAAISPWPNAGATAATFSIVGGIWLIVVQWLSSGVGGFITGRLRTKWVNVHTHEVFFRDTAHGFLTWGVAALLGAFIVASAASSAVGTATRAAGTVASGAAQGAARAYNVDTLYRGQKPEVASTNQQTQSETTRILARGMETGSVSDSDRSYLVDQVAARTGLSHDDAQKRVDDVIAQEKAAETNAREVADAARKSAAVVSIFTALSMLIGAFIASAAAAYGGSLRDEHP